MIIWLNGTFGCGKTSTASELHSQVPSTRVFDPETMGYMLRPNLADQPVSDFQHWPPWRPLVVAIDQAAVTPPVIWPGTAQNASICAATASQPIVASVNTERRISREGRGQRSSRRATDFRNVSSLPTLRGP